MRHADSWKDPGGLAVAPLLLATIMPMAARAVPDLWNPTLFRFTYTVDELVLLFILLIGTVLAAKQGFPAWSYTWVVLVVASIVAFLTSFLPALLYDVLDFGAVTFGWILTLTHLAGGLLVLGFAATRSSRGINHAFFAAALYLGSAGFGLHFLELSTNVSLIEVIIANTYSIFITALELVVIVAAVMHFLKGDANVQRRSVYILIAVALLHPILTAWVIALNFAELSVINIFGFLGLQLLGRWLYAGVTLLLTWGLIFLFIKLRPRIVETEMHQDLIGGL